MKPFILIVISLLFLIACKKESETEEIIISGPKEIVLDSMIFQNLQPSRTLCKTIDNGALIAAETTDGRILVLKTDEDLNVQFSFYVDKTFFPTRVIETEDNGILLFGYYNLTTLNLAKISESGILQWSKEIVFDYSVRGKVCITNGNIALAVANMNFDTEMMIFDQAGNLLENFVIEAFANDMNYFNGVYYMASNSGIWGLDENGYIKWLVAIEAGFVRHSKLSTGGDLISCGHFLQDNILISKISILGNELLRKVIKLNNYNTCTFIDEIPGTGYVVSGTTGENSDNKSAYILKLDNSGNILASEIFTTNINEEVLGLIWTGDSYIYFGKKRISKNKPYQFFLRKNKI